MLFWCIKMRIAVETGPSRLGKRLANLTHSIKPVELMFGLKGCLCKIKLKSVLL